MEDSFQSSMAKPMSETQTTTEESGWTAYFEDFLSTQQQDHHHHHHDLFVDDDDHHHDHHHHHLVSDAISHAEWTNFDDSSIRVDPPRIFSKKLTFINKTSRKTRDNYNIVPFDDSLEDTASSPVNSPKVGSLKEMGFNQRKQDDTIESSLGKGGGCDYGLQVEKRDGMDFEEKKNQVTDLRKRGLCLVPLTFLVKNLG